MGFLEDFFASILKPCLENVIRDFILDTKRLERFSMRQCLTLVLKVKPFKTFTAIHNSITLDWQRSYAFLLIAFFDCLPSGYSDT